MGYYYSVPRNYKKAIVNELNKTVSTYNVWLAFNTTVNWFAGNDILMSDSVGFQLLNVIGVKSEQYMYGLNYIKDETLEEYKETGTRLEGEKW